MKAIKKILFVSIAFTLLLQSCSTGHMFSKKRYGHLNWIDHDTKVETVGKDKSGDAPVKITETTKDELPVNKIQEEQEVQQTVNPKTVVVPVAQPTKEIPGTLDTKSSKSINDNKVEEQVVDEQSNTPDDQQNSFEPQTEAVKNVKESGGTMQLLAIAVLIALIILLLWLLPGIVGYLLGLVLLIFIILLLLRYLGVI